ncbi:unnamed protein product [Adineta ricciae]|uniref:G-protein coupled receptors family 1 profile domain-containing protein n=1 Tax=Adineta ricciae TaxID=249248 RepID=A0A815KEI8_ADIRI|nr:unnamed protein product [Adineta ricciae]CAF1394860.1 unnamed protein product [Adineta ricciae]
MLSLPEITLNLTFVGFFTVLFVGTTGNILNLTTLLSKDFRKQSCIFYLICCSVFDMLTDDAAIIVRFLTEYFGNNLYVTSHVVCKIRPYFFFCLPATASTCLLLAAFDRCVSTSLHAWWRRLSSMWFAKRLFSVLMLFLWTTSIFHFIVFDLRNGTCAPLPGPLSVVTTAYNLIFVSIIPDGGTFICGIITWIHIHQSKNRVDFNIHGNNQTPSNRRTNRQLVLLVFGQASVSVVIGALRSSAYAYNLLTSSVKKSIEQQQIEYFIQQSTLILFYFKFALAFYISYGVSAMFRKTFHKSMQSLKNRYFRFCKCG